MKTKIEELNISKIIDLLIFSSKQVWYATDSRVWLWKVIFAYGYWLYELVIAGWQRNDIAVPYNLVFLFNVGPGFFLCNVGKICAMLAWHFQQPVIIKKFTGSEKNRQKVMSFRRHCTRKMPGQRWTKIQDCTEHFPVQCCLESLRQHCLGYLLAQCCPKSIKITLNRIFS